eukprot:5149569-Amphidinium_carterae.3
MLHRLADTPACYVTLGMPCDMKLCCNERTSQVLRGPSVAQCFIGVYNHTVTKLVLHVTNYNTKLTQSYPTCFASMTACWQHLGS